MNAACQACVLIFSARLRIRGVEEFTKHTTPVEEVDRSTYTMAKRIVNSASCFTSLEYTWLRFQVVGVDLPWTHAYHLFRICFWDIIRRRCTSMADDSSNRVETRVETMRVLSANQFFLALRGRKCSLVCLETSAN